MNNHKRQCDVDAGYSQGWTHRSEKPVIDYRDIGDELDAQAALNDPEALAFAAKYQRAVEERRYEEELNHFMKGVDLWLKQQH